MAVAAMAAMRAFRRRVVFVMLMVMRVMVVTWHDVSFYIVRYILRYN